MMASCFRAEVLLFIHSPNLLKCIESRDNTIFLLWATGRNKFTQETDKRKFILKTKYDIVIFEWNNYWRCYITLSLVGWEGLGEGKKKKPSLFLKHSIVKRQTFWSNKDSPYITQLFFFGNVIGYSFFQSTELPTPPLYILYKLLIQKSSDANGENYLREREFCEMLPITFIRKGDEET